MNNLIKAMDLNEYNSQLCRSGCSLQHLETMGNISGLAVQDLYSGSILKPNITENKNMLDLIHTTRPDSKTKTQPSTLEVIEYESTKHDHLPDYARAMIEMIEEAEYEKQLTGFLSAGWASEPGDRSDVIQALCERGLTES